MGYGINHITNLGSPFDFVYEQIVTVPASGSLVFANEVRKLLFVITGECQHEVLDWNGAWNKVHLRPGDILALPYRCEQRYTGLEPGKASRLHIVRLSFDTAILPPLMFGSRGPLYPPGAESDMEIWAKFALREIRFLRANSDAALTETLTHLRSEMELRTLGYYPRIRALCAGLTVLFARAGVERQKSESVAGELAPGTGHHVSKIKSYLRGRLHEPTRLSEVAAFIGLSEEHTARLFKAETSLTVSEYGRRLRITKAKSLLVATDSNLSEIARQTGFSSLGVFSRNFTREVGVTPSEFRRQLARQIG